MGYATGVIMVLCAGMFWSIIPVGVRSFEEADVWQILLYRSMGLLPITLWLIHYQSNGQAFQTIRQSGLSGLLGAAGLVAAYAGGIASVRLTTIANAAFLFATAPFLTAILGWIILREPLRRTTAVALAIAIVGIYLMVSDSVSKGNWIGDVLAFVSAIGFSVFAISLRAGKLRNSLPVVFLGGLFALLLALLMSVSSGNGIAIPLHEIAIALAIGAFLLGSGMILFTFGSKVIPAAELALLCMTEVVFAPVWAWWFLNELPGHTVVLGGGIVVFAIVLNALTGLRHKPALPH
ncbi:hypothetical protein AB833_10040 [Chromatiales bacterium (ex Bugula neritina AB1)]|nr:hypothetical protein AB833_10040 [Chromatiales bacterium (ex Bugula neritina AB1)]